MTTLIGLYREYKQKAESEGVRVVSYFIFSQRFHAENYSVFVGLPRKDQCDLCLGVAQGNVPPGDLTQHRAATEKARKCKI